MSTPTVLIRVPNWIGDAVMATPAIRLLIRQWGECSVWGPPQTTTLFQHFPGITQIYENSLGREPVVGAVREPPRQVSSESFTHVYLFTNSWSSAREAKQLGIPNRIGFRRDWRGWFLTQPVLCGPRTRALPMVDYYLHLLPRSWRTPPVDRQPQLYVSEEETRAACALLQAKGLNSLSSLMGISPGASFGSAKRWDRERFQQVAAEMVNQGMAVVVLGTEQERELGDYILHGLPGHQAVNLAGETDLRLLMAIIRECRWLLTNDSGPMHLADALGTPVVALFGSTDSSWTGPQAAHHQILQAEVPCSPCFMRECPLDRACLQALTVPQVLEKIRIIQDMKSPNQTYPEQPERSTVSAEAIDFP